MYHKYTRML